MKKYYTISPIFNEGGIGSGFFSNYRIVLEKLIQFENQKIMGSMKILFLILLGLILHL
jgi:hypothetical protein